MYLLWYNHLIFCGCSFSATVSAAVTSLYILWYFFKEYFKDTVIEDFIRVTQQNILCVELWVRIWMCAKIHLLFPNAVFQ